MSRYHGRNGVLYVSTTGTGNAVPVGTVATWELNLATDKVEVTALGDSNKQYVQGLKDLKGRFSGFWDNGYEVLFDAGDSADGCKMYIYPASNASGIYWSGPAWLDASINGGVSAAVAISGEFVANGAWQRTWA